jgi:hypothetical protein
MSSPVLEDDSFCLVKSGYNIPIVFCPFRRRHLGIYLIVLDIFYRMILWYPDKLYYHLVVELN